MRRGRLRITSILAIALPLAAWGVGAWAPAAGAVPFGLPLGTAPLGVAPSYGGDCTSYPSANPFQPGFAPLPGATGSCIWIHVPTPADVQAAGGRNISLEPPGTGTVTQVSVFVGPVTGPMQVVVMRALYSNTFTPGRPNDACCFPVAASQPFTPTANSITTVPVNLPVKEDPTPPPEDITTIADFDTLGLAVLEPQVPIPLYYTGNTSDPADFIWNTSQPSTVTPGFTIDAGGFFVAMSGEWTAGGGGGGAPLIDLGNRADPVRGGNANVGIRCATVVTCIGQLLLQNGPAPGATLARAPSSPAGIAAKKLTTYGRASFSIKAKTRKAISVHLSAGGKRLLAHHRTTKVWANLTLSTGARYAIKITLKR